MAEFSTTRITPNDNVQFPAVNGQVTGYVQGSDMATKAQLDDAVTSLRTWVDARGDTTVISLDEFQILANPSLRLVTINGNFATSSMAQGTADLGIFVASAYRSIFATACAVRTSTGVICQAVLASNGKLFLTTASAISTSTTIYISCTYHY